MVPCSPQLNPYGVLKVPSKSYVLKAPLPKSPCKRCGICCLMAPCHLGTIDKNDPLKVCTNLSFSNGVASCSLIVLGFNPFEDGCSFQNDPQYKFFEAMYQKLKEHLVNAKSVQTTI
jgi:hypothetical protein